MPAGGFAVRSRAAWVSVSRHDDRDGRCSLDWDRRRRVTPVQTKSQEAWPEAEPLGWNTPLGESRGGTPTDERALQGACRIARCGGGDQRLPAFRLPSSFVKEEKSKG